MKRYTALITRNAFVLLAYAALSVTTTWPLARRMDSHVIDTKSSFDALTNAAILATRVQNLIGIGAGGVYENYFFAPLRHTIVFDENFFGLSLLHLPIYLVTQDPLRSYNILLLLCLSLAGYCTWIFVTHLTKSSLAGFIAGIAFAHCPYVFFQMSHIELVAIQWIPLFAYFCHRVFETGRFRDMIGLGLCFAMQVGSCSQYAILLLLVFIFVAPWLFAKFKPIRPRFIVNAVAAAAITALPVGFIISPYFHSRSNPATIRTESKAQETSGHLSDFLNVYSSNTPLAFLRPSADRNSEHVAFPGFTSIILVIFAFGVPIVRAYRDQPKMLFSYCVTLFGYWLIAFFTALGAAVLFHDFLVSIPILTLIYISWRRRFAAQIVPKISVAYLFFLIFTLVLFLGPFPLLINGTPVVGIFHYLHTNVPGFEIIENVYLQVILIELSIAVLSGIGASYILSGISKRKLRIGAFSLIFATLFCEFMNAPISLAEVPDKNNLPEVYKWLVRHPGPEPLATIPADGTGYLGALDDYYAIFYRRRTLNGKADRIPSITRVFIEGTKHFPDQPGPYLLHALGAKYLVVNANALSYEQAQAAIEYLDKETRLYRLIMRSQGDHLYEILPNDDPTLRLASTPPLTTNGYALVHRWQTSATASINSDRVGNAFDEIPDTSWSTIRVQTTGDWFAFEFNRPEKFIALDFINFREVFDAPLSFELAVSSSSAVDGLDDWRTIMSRPHIRINWDQVFAPERFVFRILVPQPIVTRRVRVKLISPMPGFPWSIHETRLWVVP